MTISSVCPLDEVAEAPAKAASLSLDAALTLLARGGAVCEVLRARVGALQASPAITAPANGAEEWLTLEEAGRLIGRHPRWFTRRRGRLPFVKRLSGRTVVVSKSGLARWIAAQKS